MRQQPFSLVINTRNVLPECIARVAGADEVLAVDSALMHIAAVIHSPKTELFLPPHRE